MILRFRHKGLERLFKAGSKAGIVPGHAQRLKRILTVLNVAEKPDDVDIDGFDLHPLHGSLAGYWSVSVSGNWRVIYRFERRDVTGVDYLDYH
ncbi:MAG: type II toxin-antitoxin system RelE/ParE family toxin [Nitrospiria bacterium]